MVTCDALMALEVPGWAGPLVEACRSSGRMPRRPSSSPSTTAGCSRSLAAGRRRSAGRCWPPQASTTSRSPGCWRRTVTRWRSWPRPASRCPTAPGACSPRKRRRTASRRASQDGRALLTGVKPWCSLAALLDAALVTAHVGDDRQLFRVSLRHPSVTPDPPRDGSRAGCGPSPARPSGSTAPRPSRSEPPGWYLDRPGFAWGGMGVAACWHGGARGLRATLARQSAERTGRAFRAARRHRRCRTARLRGRARRCRGGRRCRDRPRARRARSWRLRVRAVVANAAERTIRQVGPRARPGAARVRRGPRAAGG